MGHPNRNFIVSRSQVMRKAHRLAKSFLDIARGRGESCTYRDHLRCALRETWKEALWAATSPLRGEDGSRNWAVMAAVDVWTGRDSAREQHNRYVSRVGQACGSTGGDWFDER